MLKHKLLYLLNVDGDPRGWGVGLFFQGADKGYRAVNLESGGSSDKLYKSPEEFKLQVRSDGLCYSEINEYIVQGD